MRLLVFCRFTPPSILFQPQKSLTSVQWLSAAICFCLSQLLVGDSLSTAMPGCHLKAYYSISNIRDWCLSMEQIPSWACYWSAFPSVSSPFRPCSSLRQEQFWVKNFDSGLVILSVQLILFGILQASCMFMGISFFRLGKFSSIILLKIFTGL